MCSSSTLSEPSSRVQAFLGDYLPQQPGFQANPVQLAYASSITSALAQPRKLHFIEGDTGIGKSLAYSLALADWVARGKAHGRRAVVATHTRALQRQLMDPGHRALVQAYLSQEGLPSLSIGVRMGRNNYVSPARLALAMEAPDLATVALDRERPAHERALAEWALDTPGCLLDIDEGMLPEGVATADVCLLPQEPLPKALEAHFHSTQGHDVLIINHALLALDLVTAGSITQAHEPYALLLDEADRFPDAAESILSERLSLRASVALLSQMKAKAAAARCRDMFEAWVTPGLAGHACPLTNDMRRQLSDVLLSICRARPNQAAAGEALLAEWHHLKERAVALVQRLESQQGGETLVTYSPVQGLPSIVAQEPSAGRCLKSGASSRVTIMTSATLSDMQHGLGEPPRFDYLRGRLQLGAADGRLGKHASHSARHFGRLRFTLPADMPQPLWSPEAGRYELSPTFSAMASRRIASLGGRVLVLSSSYADSDSIRATWPSDDSRLVTHAPGVDLNMLAAELDDDAVLVTPAGWEGLSPVRDGKAFWDHVVILRLPHPAPDPVLQTLLEQRFQQYHGLTRADAAQRARRTLRRQGAIRATHKLRQGLGRAIRHPDDEVHLVILDPRFPSPAGTAAGEGMRRHAQLLGAIPFRFLASYRKAETRWAPMDAVLHESSPQPDKMPSWRGFL